MKFLPLLLLTAVSAKAQFMAHPWYASDAAASAVICDATNLWVQPIYQSSMGGTEGTLTYIDTNSFGCEKIKNISPVETTIRRFRLQVSTSVTPINGAYLTALARSSPDLASGVTYGSYSVTNFVPTTAFTYSDFYWSVESAPTIPANTDFYIGIVPVGGVGGVKMLNQSDGGGYGDTNYGYYSNSVSSPTLDLDFAIYVCQPITLASCTSTSMWTYPVLQQQTNGNTYSGFSGAGGWGQKIQNLSAVPVKIKKARFSSNQAGFGDAYMFVTARTHPLYYYGFRYGDFSSGTYVTNIDTTVWYEVSWADGKEPYIPAGTDFYYYINNYGQFGRILPYSVSGGTAYDGTTYSSDSGSGGPEAASSTPNEDLTFELYVCEQESSACLTNSTYMPPYTNGMLLCLESDLFDCQGANYPVYTWVDKSTNNKSFTGSALVGSVLANGHRTVRFNGGQSLQSTPFFTSGYTGLEVFCVFMSDLDVPAVANSVFLFSRQSNESHHPASDGNFYENFGIAGRPNLGNPSTTTSNTFVVYNVSSKADGTAYDAFMDGENFYHITGGYTYRYQTDGSYYWLGRMDTTPYYWLGSMAAIYVYDHPFNSTERTNMRTYLHDRWGTASP